MALLTERRGETQQTMDDNPDENCKKFKEKKHLIKVEVRVPSSDKQKRNYKNHIEDHH